MPMDTCRNIKPMVSHPRGASKDSPANVVAAPALPGVPESFQIHSRMLLRGSLSTKERTATAPEPSKATVRLCDTLLAIASIIAAFFPVPCADIQPDSL